MSAAAKKVSRNPTKKKSVDGLHVKRAAATSAGKEKTSRDATPKRTSVKEPARQLAQPSSGTVHPEVLAYNAEQLPRDKAICDKLSAAIARHLKGKGAENLENKIWHRHPVWFLDGNPIVGYHKLKDCVRLLFWSGRSFDEPGLTPEGGFQTAGARYVDEKEISITDLARWLAKSITTQWDYKNIMKRKGRLERLK